MAKKIRASAPNKVILFGEHFVVYGAPAVAIPTDNRNVVELEQGEGKIPRLVIRSSLGHALQWADGRFDGPEILRAVGAVYLEMRGKGIVGDEELVANIISSGAPKGMGASSSIAGALAAALYAFYGKTPSGDELFSLAQACDTIAHGGKPSGIDAKTTTSGKAQRFMKKFNPTSFVFEAIDVRFPKGTALLVIDTFAGARSSTGELIAKFAAAKGIAKKPEEMDEEERGKIYGEYEKIYRDAVRELNENGDARKLGRLMNDNHLLLAKGNVSSGGIEGARDAALGAGALGAKLTGGGGEGGSVIALVGKEKAKETIAALKSAGFNSFVVALAKEGAKAD